MNANQPLLIYNPWAGLTLDAKTRLLDILGYLWGAGLQPTVFSVNPNEEASPVIQSALQNGCDLVIACGGDGTVHEVAQVLAGTQATLGILPIGTRNNIAYSLGIPILDIEEAVGLLRSCEPQGIDLGQVSSNGKSGWSVEVCSVGLLSALYEGSDELQKGNLLRAGDLLATYMNFPLAEYTFWIDEYPTPLHTQAHGALIVNTPYFGPRFQLSSNIQVHDGLLDVFFLSDLNKMELINYTVQLITNILPDPRVQHFQVRSIRLKAEPAMPVMVDGDVWGEGQLDLRVAPQSLKVLCPQF